MDFLNEKYFMNVIWDNGEEVGTGEELQTGKDISQEEWERRRHRNIFIIFPEGKSFQSAVSKTAISHTEKLQQFRKYSNVTLSLLS